MEEVPAHFYGWQVGQSQSRGDTLVQGYVPWFDQISRREGCQIGKRLVGYLKIRMGNLQVEFRAS